MNLAAEFIQSIINAFEGNKRLADRAVEQVPDDKLHVALDANTNSIAVGATVRDNRTAVAAHDDARVRRIQPNSAELPLIEESQGRYNESWNAQSGYENVIGRLRCNELLRNSLVGLFCCCRAPHWRNRPDLRSLAPHAPPTSGRPQLRTRPSGKAPTRRPRFRQPNAGDTGIRTGTGGIGAKQARGPSGRDRAGSPTLRTRTDDGIASGAWPKTRPSWHVSRPSSGRWKRDRGRALHGFAIPTPTSPFRASAAISPESAT